MNIRMISAFVFLLSACAEGIEPPVPTAMVSVTSGLDFQFGPEGMCRKGGAGSDAESQTCSSTGPLDLRYPKVRVQLDPFAIDVHEVTNYQYKHCVARGECTNPENENAADINTQQYYYSNSRYENYPVLNINWEQAQEYCNFVGKRLPTEFEWERVAKGGGSQARQFPTETGIQRVNECFGVFNSPGCDGNRIMQEVATSETDYVVENGEKIFDLGSNAAEWTSTPWHEKVTCKDKSPCPSMSECASLSDGAERGACELKASTLPDEPGGCSECLGMDDAECYYMCEELASVTSLVCTAYSDAVARDPNSIVGPSSSMSVRGGSVTVTGAQTCLHSSWDRSQKFDKSKTANFLGFRCAKDL